MWTFLVSGIAGATSGGPETMEVLGYDPVDQKVFVAQHFQDQSGEPPRVYYATLRDDAKWVRAESLENEDFAVVRETLARRVIPLEVVEEESFQIEVRYTSQDRSVLGWPCFHIVATVIAANGERSLPIEALSYINPIVTIDQVGR